MDKFCGTVFLVDTDIQMALEKHKANSTNESSIGPNQASVEVLKPMTVANSTGRPMHVTLDPGQYTISRSLASDKGDYAYAVKEQPKLHLLWSEWKQQEELGNCKIAAAIDEGAV